MAGLGSPVPGVREPVGDRIPPSRCRSTFWQVRRGTGDLAAARSFTCPSSRDVDWFSSGIRRRRAWVPRSAVWGPIGHCISPVAPPVAPSHGRFVTFRAHHCPLCRSIDGVSTSARNGVWDQPVIVPPHTCAGDPTQITPIKGTYSGKIESLDQDPRMRFPELTSLVLSTANSCVLPRNVVNLTTLIY